jgi:putative redox protein
MSAAAQVTRVVATTSSSDPAYAVDVRAGTHHLVADESAAAGGGDAGPNPFRLFLSGLAACTAMTLRMYAERKGWDVATIEVRVDYMVPDGGAARIERTIRLPSSVPPEQRDRLADIAERTPVTLAVRAGTPITTTIAIEETSA